MLSVNPGVWVFMASLVQLKSMSPDVNQALDVQLNEQVIATKWPNTPVSLGKGR